MSTTTAVFGSERGRVLWDLYPHEFCTAYNAWLETHGIDTGHTYRVEHHTIDAPLIRVFQYAVDGRGQHYIDPETGDIARRDPFDVLITTPPPRPEDYA